VERTDVEQHDVYLSDVHFRIVSSCATTNRYLRRHWRAAGAPIVEPADRCQVEVIADDSPRIVVDGEVLWSDGLREDLVAGFEQRLYGVAMARHRRRFAVFHASALVSDRVSVVFAGRSGAGKSSLALAAVRRGWRYFSDEFAVTDGERLWGWPRAIRFDPPPTKSERPDYLADLPLDPDALERDHEGGPPFYSVPEGSLARAARPAREVHFVHVERGADTTLAPATPSLGLKYWTEAAFFPPEVPLGSLVGVDRAWRASWRHPDELIALFEAR
jgi:hypothetical protein